MKKKHQIVEGFSLVEVALALAIASFCLITLLALLSVGLQHFRDADIQSTMVNLTTMIARDLEVTPSGSSPTASPRFAFLIPAAGGSVDTNPQVVYFDASGNVTAGSARVYRVNVAFSPPAAGQRGATTARILITWPAAADGISTAWPANYSGMLETTVSLNRN